MNIRFGSPTATLLGERARYCDGVSRRSFLTIGGLAVGGLTLPGLLKAEKQAGIRSSNKSVIMVYLAGGLAHQDTFDLKPDAPVGIRGEFKPIPTAIPGVQISEHLPLLARAANRMAILRSVVGQRDEHSSFQSLTGHVMGDTLRQGYPSFGSVISKLNGPADAVTPAFVDLFPTMQHRPYNSPGPGALGPRYAQVKADGEQLASMKLRMSRPPNSRIAGVSCGTWMAFAGGSIRSRRAVSIPIIKRPSTSSPRASW